MRFPAFETINAARDAYEFHGTKIPEILERMEQATPGLEMQARRQELDDDVLTPFFRNYVPKVDAFDEMSAKTLKRYYKTFIYVVAGLRDQ